MNINLKTAKILTFAGGGIAIAGAVIGQIQRADCEEPGSWGWGLIHSLAVMNRQLREEACIRESLASPSTLILVIGLIALAAGVTFWLRLSGKTLSKNVKCPHCAETILKEAKVCKHCGKDVGPTDVNESN